ncbi:MAG: hypothetical protein ACREIF_11265 [Chthoniobacterales bacterium]
MKPTSIAPIGYQLARHDRRVHDRRVCPVTDYFFRPLADVAVGRVGPRPGGRARRAFCRMTAEMVAKHKRDEPLEIFVFALVTLVVAWPLVSLLVVLAQTAGG